MTDYAGVARSSYDVCDQYAESVPRAVYEGFLFPDPEGFASSAPTSGGASGIVAPRVDRPGRLKSEADSGYDWFEHAHIVPRSAIDFGNIVTTVQQSFELFSMHRQAVTLDSIVSTVGAGVDIVDSPTLPYTLSPFCSLLDPASTRFSPVPTTFEATPDGLPVFDGLFEFFLSTGEELDVELMGARITLLAPEPESPFVERMQFATDVLQKVDASEQRVSVRKNYRQNFDFRYLLDGTERRVMQNLLFGWQSRSLAVPLWHERELSVGALSVGDTAVNVATTADVDFRAGGQAVVFETPNKFDVVVIDSVGPTSLVFSTTPLTHAYASGTLVMPVRTCIVSRQPTGAKYPRNLEAFSLSLQVTDNDTGVLAGDTSGWDSYDGKVLLDDANVMDDTTPEQFEQKVTVVDNQTGVIVQSSRWDTNRRVSQKGFRARSRAEVLKLRKLLVALGGRQKSFYVPTFDEDLLLVADLGAGGLTMDVENCGYTRFCQQRANKNVIRLTFTDGTSLVRVVQGSVEVSEDVERLSVDANWPADRAVSEVVRIEFFELVRFAADELTLNYDRAGLVRLVAPVQAVSA